MDTLASVKFLRKQGLTDARCRLVLEQITLRPIAKRKFSSVESMFFERTLLEQATDERLAAFKAARFGDAKTVVDICCGLAGDLIALAKHANRAECFGIDASGVAVHLARANCPQATIIQQLAEEHTLPADAWVHIDPDRRVEGRRTTTLEFFSPDAEYLSKLIQQQKNVAIKLAPVTRLPPDWSCHQRQWLGSRQECKQQMVWCGATSADNDRPNQGAETLRTATAIDNVGSVIFDWHETEPGRCEVAADIGDYLYEPHATVIAGRMIDSLANRYGLTRLAADVQYLTGAEVDFPALTRFRVLERCRVDDKEVRERLRFYDAGHLEIKKRGVEHQLIDRFAKLKLSGDQSLVLVLTRLRDKYIALICKREI